MMTKKECRAFYKKIRAEISTCDRQYWNQAICEHVLHLPQYEQAEVILVYSSFGDEAGTERLIRASLSAKKEVYLPRVLGNRQMEFYQVGQNSLSYYEDCRAGAYGILEPLETCKKFTYFNKKKTDIFMILPGLAFDKKGNRLGYGAAYYDTYLRKLMEGQEKEYHRLYTCGICYHVQVCDNLPTESHDIKLNQIITEKGYLL